jgi:hypothetical protein
MKKSSKRDERRVPLSENELSVLQTEFSNGGHSDVKQSAPQPHDVKERLKANRHKGPIRPLNNLKATEGALQARSEILAELSTPTQSCPTPEMLINKIIEMVDLIGVPLSLQKKKRMEVVSWYRALDPIDATDSMLVQLMMAMHISAMQALGRRTSNPQACVVNYRHAENATKTIIALSELRTRRRNPTTVKVENVNVNSGVQAIIRNVEVSNSGANAELDSEPISDIAASVENGQNISQRKISRGR